MPNWLGRLLCRVGLHEWVAFGGWGVVWRACLRCGKQGDGWL